MGILGNQPPRENYNVSADSLDCFLSDTVELAKKYKISVDSVINAKHVMELARQNNLMVQHGDYFDEQIGGLGSLLEKISERLD